jgi:hypothetical protein
MRSLLSSEGQWNRQLSHFLFFGLNAAASLGAGRRGWRSAVRLSWWNCTYESHVLKQDLVVSLFMASVRTGQVVQMIQASWVVNWNECGSQEKPQWLSGLCVNISTPDPSTVGSARLHNLRRAVTNHSAQLQTGCVAEPTAWLQTDRLLAFWRCGELCSHLTSSHPSIRGPPHKQLIVAHLVKDLHSFFGVRRFYLPWRLYDFLGCNSM